MDNITNFGKAQVSTGYDSTATSIVLAGGNGVKLPDPPFNLVWWNATDYGDPSDDPNVEIVRCTGKSTDTLAVVRAQEDTIASAKNLSGKTYKMILAPTKKVFDDIDTEAQTKVNTHAALTSTHGVTKVAGLESDGSIILTTNNKSQLKIRDVTGVGGSITLTPYATRALFSFGINCEYDGTNWNRINTAHPAWRIRISTSPNASQYIYGASEGTNPITTWDLANAIPIMKSHRGENVSSSVHPNAMTHIDAVAPHSGHEVLTSKNATNGYAGLSGGKLADSQMPGILNKYSLSDAVIQNNDAEVSVYANWMTKVKEITINSLYKTPATVRVSFDLKTEYNSEFDWDANGRIYKNGSPYGPLQYVQSRTSGGNYVTFTDDLSFGQGDTIELWICAGGPWHHAYARNFRVKGQSVQLSLAETIVDGNIGLLTPYAFTNTL